ncbi:hypothetical protein TOPH_09124 [Tolypocladium ophioglossoides CBS 100239]|uniref:Uncharacterized protein n=1 Tax=Tolypocladium ophioglossoides (strain CBS 100239) TaxID=1163406 RepID=A0A0L0MWU1_TOLOC|nr:hypothetical protein TOPH_09124 [Tolypocladium ophioglossoides CBS 100239]
MGVSINCLLSRSNVLPLGVSVVECRVSSHWPEVCVSRTGKLIEGHMLLPFNHGPTTPHFATLITATTLHLASFSSTIMTLLRNFATSLGDVPPFTLGKSFMMPGEDALNGISEKIDGWHTFIVTDQKKVVASGVVIMIFAPEEFEAKWYGNDTGGEQDVAEGYKVEVLNVTIYFTK